jgi:hypothetical protein
MCALAPLLKVKPASTERRRWPVHVRTDPIRRACSCGYVMAENDLMVMAGMLDEWKLPKSEHLRSCPIITCPPSNIAAAPPRSNTSRSHN